MECWPSWTSHGVLEWCVDLRRIRGPSQPGGLASSFHKREHHASRERSRADLDLGAMGVVPALGAPRGSSCLCSDGDRSSLRSEEVAPACAMGIVPAFRAREIAPTCSAMQIVLAFGAMEVAPALRPLGLLLPTPRSLSTESFSRLQRPPGRPPTATPSCSSLS